MACLFVIDAYAIDEHALPPSGDLAFDEIDRIDRLMSHYKPASPLSQINSQAGHQEVAVDPELFEFIRDSLQYSRDSDGAFDITVGQLMKAWGFSTARLGRLTNPGLLWSSIRLIIPGRRSDILEIRESASLLVARGYAVFGVWPGQPRWLRRVRLRAAAGRQRFGRFGPAIGLFGAFRPG